MDPIQQAESSEQSSNLGKNHHPTIQVISERSWCCPGDKSTGHKGRLAEWRIYKGYKL